eukprot:2087356-Pyramimonas_sp.AAC.1
MVSASLAGDPSEVGLVEALEFLGLSAVPATVACASSSANCRAASALVRQCLQTSAGPSSAMSFSAGSIRLGALCSSTACSSSAWAPASGRRSSSCKAAWRNRSCGRWPTGPR